jgi:hypothetical protein
MEGLDILGAFPDYPVETDSAGNEALLCLLSLLDRFDIVNDLLGSPDEIMPDSC